MLRPDSRVVLLDQLRPPAGYKLEAAIATTFTLELGAALVPPLAFATHGIIAPGDPLAVLESVRSASDRIDIYCQAGQIVVPKRASDLMAFLEPMLHPVRPPRNGYLFHPKVWFVHYTANDGPDRYRFLCLTRNLVDSQAWDAAVVLDGADSGQVLEVNRPLDAFLRFLPAIAVNPSEERAQRARALADRAARVQWIHPNGVTGFSFHAWGVPGVEDTVDYSGLRHLVISPFCDNSGLDHVTDGNRRAIVVSRGEALDALEPASLSRYRLGTDEGSIFVLDALADPPPERTEAEADDPDAGGEPTQYSAFRLGELTGLHAKVTVIEKNRKAHVIVGSANATSAAFGGNVEFGVEMWGRTQDLGFRTLMDRGPHKGQRNFRDLLQPYVAGGSAIEPVEEELRRLRNLLRRLAAVPLRISVKGGPANYVLLLSSDEAMSLPEDHEMRFELLTRPGVSRLHVPGLAVEAGFDGVPLEDITPFVVLKLRGPDGTVVDTVIHAPLVNDPQDRLDAVLARQVNSREKFLRFLALVLGLADPTAAWELTGGSASVDGPWGSGSGTYPGVFELVITAMADRPKAIVELDRLVTRMRQTDQGRQLFPEGFEELWANVQLALAQMRKKP